MRLFGPLFGKYNPFHPDFLRDPYPRYARLRSQAPAYRHPIFRVVYLSRYDDVLRVLRDPSFSMRRMETETFKRVFPIERLDPDLLEALRSNLLMIDPPDHTRIRNLVNKAFTPRMVEKLQPRIGALVDELLDAAAEAGQIEFMRDFAVPLPVTVIAEMLGVPPEDRERFKRWSNDMAALLDPLTALGGLDGMEASFAEFSDYLDGVFAARRREPRDDLISALVAVEEGGVHLTQAELRSLVALILGAGHETTTNLLGNAIVTLLRHPHERERFQNAPALAESAIEEFLRFEPPVQVTDRVCTKACEIAGEPIRPGEIVVALLAAANRDPERFPAPDRLDLGRADNRHLSFGQGAHFCLGAHLARVEARIALSRFVERFPAFQGDVREVAWRRSLILRGPTALPLVLEA